MPDDHTLLLIYACSHDADAFAQLVKRYSALVFSIASRVTGNTATAEDVTQDCFFALARKAASIRGSLPAWLHRVALNRSMQVARNEARRQRHEERVPLPSDADYESNWNQVAPIIDAAIAKLPDELREPLVQHFLLGRKQTKIAKSLGIDQATVSRRLHEGIERLREHLKQTGVVCGSIALSTVLFKNASAAVPAKLAASLAKMALAGPATAAATASTSIIPSYGGLKFTLVKGALKLMALTKLKTAVVAGVITIMAAGTAAVIVKETGNSLVASESFTDDSVSPAGGAVARAETLLRYKFIPGGTSHYVINRDEKIIGGTDKTSYIGNSIIIDVTNKVESIDAKGNASITILMNRLKMTAKSMDCMTEKERDGGVLFDYDTASREKPKGMNKIFALVYEVLTKKPIALKESPLGKINDIRMPEGLNEAIKKATVGTGQLGGTVPSEEELSDSINKGIKIIFPNEPVYEGKTWTVNEDVMFHVRIGLQALEGIQKIKTTFRYLGKENKDGKNLDKISVTEELKSPGKLKVLHDSDNKVKIELRSLSTEGTIYFDNSAGIMVQYNSQSKSKFKVAVIGIENDKTANDGEGMVESINTSKLVPADSKAEINK